VEVCTVNAATYVIYDIHCGENFDFMGIGKAVAIDIVHHYDVWGEGFLSQIVSRG